MPYSTLVDVKAWLGVTSSTHDDMITSLIDVADRFIVQQTGVKWLATLETRTFDARRDVRNYGRDLFIGHHTSVTSVTNGDSTIVDDYIRVGALFSEPKQILRMPVMGGKVWTWVSSSDPSNAISISANFGYADAVPADIEQLSIELTSWLYRGRDHAVPAEVLLAGKGGIIITPASLPPHIRKRLIGLREVF